MACGFLRSIKFEELCFEEIFIEIIYTAKIKRYFWKINPINGGETGRENRKLRDQFILQRLGNRFTLGIYMQLGIDVFDVIAHGF